MFVFLTLLIIISFNLSDGLRITIPQGTIEALQSNSRNGSPFYSFYGIPYAKAPIGSLRFQPPQTPDPWQRVRNASAKGSMCVQYDPTSHMFLGDEDCLFINVFTKLNSGSVPVIVFIHGGGLSWGSGTQDGPYTLMDKDIVLVTINYRLGAFGFLSAVDNILPGNNGMKDQVQALRWIQQNIKYFGGNANSVTLAGHSAGGSSVSAHQYSTLSNGLFHKVIAMSSSALNSWYLTPTSIAIKRFQSYATINGCIKSTTLDIVNCLRAVPAPYILRNMLKLHAWVSSPPAVFTVVVEPEQNGAFLTKDPSKTTIINNNIPLIAGFTSKEGYYLTHFFLTHHDMEEFNEYYRWIFPILFKYGLTARDGEDVTGISESIKKYYFGEKNIDGTSIENWSALLGDMHVVNGVIEAAIQYKGPKYFYVIDDPIDAKYYQHKGVAHGEELSLLFSNNNKTLTAPVETNSKFITNAWAAFAATGNPNSNSSTTKWNPISTSELEYLYISQKIEMNKKPNWNAYQFWKSLHIN